MLKSAFSLCLKDLKLAITHGSGIIQSLLLGLLLIFLFSVSLNAGEKLSPQTAVSMFWLASAFCQVLIFNMLYALEESAQARLGLLLLPVPVQSVWFGKMFAGLALMLLSQLIFIPAVFVFLGQHLTGSLAFALAGLLLGDLGMAASGSLLGALAVGKTGRESLLSVILFPLLVPLLLASVKLLCTAVDPEFIGEPLRWLGLAGAFDALFLAAGLVLFPFVYNGEN